MTPEHRAVIERIRSSAVLVRQVVETAPRARLAVAPSPGEWSSLETLTHLRDVIVHVYGLRVRRLFYEDAPLFADFDEEAYRPASLARGESVEYLLDTFVGEQEQLARLLEAVPDEEWAREGTHPQDGVISIEFLARPMGEHAEVHAAQVLAPVQGG